MTNADKIERVNTWQDAGFVHPLTCINSNHPKLIPVEEDGEIVLKCSKCKYVQKNIPPSVLDVSPQLMEDEKKRMIEMGFKFD